MARVLLDGRVATVGVVSEPAESAAGVVTGLSEAEAVSRAPTGADGPPILVHDGPVGREAWLHLVGYPDGPARWVFMTAGGTYERKAGEPLGGPAAQAPDL